MRLKWITIPFGKKDIAACETWEVRWLGRTGIYSSDTVPEVAVFVSEDEAKEFADALRNAFELLKITGAKTGVNVRKQK